MKKVSAETVARTICLSIALANQVLAVCGKKVLPFSDDEVYQAVSLAATLTTSAVAWWKNNSFTQAAIAADGVMRELKDMESDF